MTVNWDELPHAYGPATDIPSLLRAARTGPAPTSPNADPWFSLWSALCHQGDVYWASYAALPELLAIAAERTDGVRSEAVLLAAGIELGRHASSAPEMPPQLREPYDRAAAGAVELIEGWSGPATEIESRQWAIAAATFRGDLREASRLLDEDEV